MSFHFFKCIFCDLFFFVVGRGGGGAIFGFGRSFYGDQLPRLPPLPITAVVIIPWARFNHIAPFFLKQMAFHIL